MAIELRCTSCEGELGWAGGQVSCRSCGKVFTMAGKPGSKFGVLVVGVGIGIILGFIAAYELNRFVLGVQDREGVETVETEAVEARPLGVADPVNNTREEQPVASKSEDLNPYVNGAEFSALKLAQNPEVEWGKVVAETEALKADFEFHSATPMMSDKMWLYGRLINRSAVTIARAKVFALDGDLTVKLPPQDSFYSEADCLAPGDSDWVKALVDFSSAEGLRFEVYPETPSLCVRPLEHLVVEHAIKVDSSGKRIVYGSVQNQEKAPVQFVQVYANVFHENRFVAQESTYLQGVLAAGAAQRFELTLPAGEGKIEVSITGRFYKP